jgi:hypothetical protein
MKKTKKMRLSTSFPFKYFQDSFETKVIDDLVNPGAAKKV